MSLQELKLEKKPELYINQDLKDQINFLHNKIGATEWSGVLFYSVKSGSINNPSELKLEATAMYLMDIGTSVYTEYTAGLKLIDAYDTIPGSENQQYGHIHTHHNMQTFFSGTDKEELVDNAVNFNYYLSLIVNFKGDYSAKIAIHTNVEKSMSIVDENHKPSLIKSSTTEVFTIDCKIVYNNGKVPFDTDKVYSELKKAEKLKAKTTNRFPVKPFNNVNQLGAMTAQSRMFDVGMEIREDIIEEVNDSALAILNQVGITYSNIEELTASVVANDMNNKSTLADVTDKYYNSFIRKSPLKINIKEVDAIYETACSNVALFIEFNNIDLPETIIFEAMQDCLDDQKDQSGQENKLYNGMIDELIEAVEYIGTEAYG